jgi:hypothetical protein
MNVAKVRNVVGAKGARKKGVVLSIRRYQRLMEDLHDLAAVAERRDEPSISYEDMKRRLKRSGLL